MAANNHILTPIVSLLLDDGPPVYTDIHSRLYDNCGGSNYHGGGKGGYTVSGVVLDSYNSAKTKINVASPANSLLLTEPSTPISSNDHGGG